jgi:hypothetical protein
MQKKERREKVLYKLPTSKLRAYSIVVWGHGNKWTNEQGVCHTMAFPFTLKSVARPCKRRIMKTQIFHHAKI